MNQYYSLARNSWRTFSRDNSTKSTRYRNDRLSPDKLAKESDDIRGQERYRASNNWSNVGWLDIATAGSGTPLQGGSGWSISDALYVTNLRTRRSLMPVRGPWCGRVYAWVIKYDEKREGSDAVDLLGFLNVRHALPMRLLVVAVALVIVFMVVDIECEKV